MLKHFAAIALLLLGIVTAKAQITCNTDTFYSMGNTDSGCAIYQYAFIGGSVFIDTIPITASTPGRSLGIADLGDGPKFYGGGHDTIFKYNGSSWDVVYIDSIGGAALNNTAGHGPFLYFQTNLNPSYIYRFNGTSLSLIATDTSYFRIAGIAVDSAGRVYEFTGPIWPNITRLRIISPSGAITTLPTSFNGTHGYGCFFNDGQLYLGLGRFNPVYPNMIVPVNIGASSVTLGTGMPMYDFFVDSTIIAAVHYDAIDLAACSGKIHIVDGHENSVTDYFTADLTISPNPITNNFIVAGNVGANAVLTIRDVTGRKIHTQFVSSGSTNIDMADKLPGVYVVTIVSKDIAMSRKVVKY